jgi:hydroxymethylglutaryl-CoA reductase (NADPH)
MDHADDTAMRNASAPVERLLSLPCRDADTVEAQKARLDFLRDHADAHLPGVAQTTLNPTSLSNNVEAFIGTVEVPVGVAGPLLIQGSTGAGEVYVPLATTEGALVASANRGTKAISLSGGARAHTFGQRVMRTPSFEFGSMADALVFVDWVLAHAEALREHVGVESRHARLISIDPELFGRRVHLHFVYQTGDAAGQNMVTACTERVLRWLAVEAVRALDVSIRNFYLDAGLSNDKRLTARSFVQSRGIRVSAEATLKAEVVRRVLKQEPERLVATYHYWCTTSQVAGNVGSGLNIANTLAAIFTATGQDIACVHESSVAAFYVALEGSGDVYVSLTMPSLMVATVGGGTGLPQQRECLALMGCAGVGKVGRFAEIVATAVMALDLSLLAAFSAGHFAEAHQRMGRNRPVEAGGPVG